MKRRASNGGFNLFELLFLVFNVCFTLAVFQGVTSLLLIWRPPGWVMIIGCILGLLAWPALLWFWLSYEERKCKKKRTKFLGR